MSLPNKLGGYGVNYSHIPTDFPAVRSGSTFAIGFKIDFEGFTFFGSQFHLAVVEVHFLVGFHIHAGGE